MDQMGRHDARAHRPIAGWVGDTETYAREREQRRRRRSFGAAAVPVGMSLSLGLSYGVIWGLIPIFVLVGIVGVGRLVMCLQERKHRDGDRSWPARMPIVFARKLGGVVPAVWGNELELLGRIYKRASGWEWMPTPNQAKQKVGPVAFGPQWHASTRRIWGPWNQGALTLATDRDSVVLWMRRPRNLKTTTGYAHESIEEA
jgi:hypothetical protein